MFLSGAPPLFFPLPLKMRQLLQTDLKISYFEDTAG
jgi:hypothetical protein